MLISIEVNPYTAFVGCPVVVEKFSTGCEKNARYASECPSSNSNRGLVSVVCVSELIDAATGLTLVCG
jgi:hypothetical protein